MTLSDEAELQTQIEQASAEQLGALLRDASDARQAALRELLGAAGHSRLLGLAMRFRSSGGEPGQRGNVIIIPGLLGCSLSEFTAAGPVRLWLDMPQLAAGAFSRLRLEPDGRSAMNDVRATGVSPCTYGALLLTLGQHWNVRAFWYDWRKGFELAADELAGRAATWFGADEPFHIVAHSTGGLVARAFVQRHPRQWQAGGGKTRLIMLGTPQHGSFTACQLLSGLDLTLRKLASAQQQGTVSEIVDVVRTFPGVYALLPSPLREPTAAALYDAEIWDAAPISQAHLDQAKRFHESLVTAVDPLRMVQIVGCHQPTLAAIDDYEQLDQEESYQLSMQGDGLVTHAFAELATVQGQPIRTYYVDQRNANLPIHPDVLLAVNDLLTAGTSQTLASIPLGARGGRGGHIGRPWKADMHQQRRLRFDAGLTRLRSWQVARQRSAETGFRGSRSAELAGSTERELGSWLAAEFVGEQFDAPLAPEAKLPLEPATIHIRLLHSGIESIDEQLPSLLAQGGIPVDAIAVGHYLGVRPQSAELALDKAISGRGDDAEPRLLLTELSERGVITGELARTFFLADPRQPAVRTLAIAGMGLPGRLGIPELTVVVRELCWALGRIGKQHLATVLIGAGGDNLREAEAVSAWIRGIKHAISGTAPDDPYRLQRITLVCRSMRTLRGTQEALKKEKQQLHQLRRLEIILAPWSEEELEQAEQREAEQEQQAATAAKRARGRRQRSSTSDLAPTRITATLDQETYRFGAITNSAAVPERDIPLDPRLVRQANDELVGGSLAEQYEAGLFLQKLLLPTDFRDTLLTSAPLVLSLDVQTARIHWEMVAQAGFSGMPAMLPNESLSIDLVQGLFWGTVRGLTRQLRTTFAPPPEPPPPAQRLLRVLVVADPAKDAPLAGAMEEGYEVAELFERFNRVHQQGLNRVEVVRLLGPREATRTAVLKHLMLRSYDVFHFAGHCHYDTEHPQRSGWLFSNSEQISVRELSRIDRVPKFVFSNACESGVTADRPQNRTPGLAPSFAEAAFARGVTNFVCTAWPINDWAARQFAHVLYCELLGLGETRSDGQSTAVPQPLHIAMQRARLALVTMPEGVTTWGAYQHYGNPYYRFFQTLPEPAHDEQ